MGSKISVIVPVYLSEKYLDKCVQSVLSQSHTDLELILIDDGSPDNSGVICDKYSSSDKRVVVIHQENTGTCGARNKGLEVATGDYVMFLDGDDYLASDCLSYLYSLLIDNSADMSMSMNVFTNFNLSQVKKDNVVAKTGEQAACDILYVNTPVGPWNKLYKMSVIKNNNITFAVKWFGEGLYFSSMVAQCSKTVACGNRKVYYYRKNNPNSGTTERKVGNGINSLNNIIYIKDNLVLKTNETIKACDWHIWNNNFNLIMYIVGSKDGKKQYFNYYKDSKKYLRKNIMKIFFQSRISFTKRVMVIALSLFPVTCSKIELSIKNKRFKKALESSDF